MKKRILFVDDEQSVLDGLKRSLHRYRDRWDTCFAVGGEAGLAELRKGAFDVVVSDLRMPGMDGYTFLTHVRDDHPDTIRIVLSGQTEYGTALRSISICHQFLAKPCEGEQLHRILERACAVRDLCADERLRTTLSRLGKLPSLPKLYLELTKAMGDENTSAADIGVIIESDMAMSVKILQVVNSAYFGLTHEVSSVRQAVAYLGQSMIRSLALSEQAFSSFRPNKTFSVDDLEREQAHGLLTASLARALCTDPKMGEQAFLAGMLHDIGITLFATQFPGDVPLRAAASSDAAADGDHESRAFGSTHAEVGAFLLGAWGLPLRVTEAVAFHHDPVAIDHDEFDVVTAVHVADALIGEYRPVTSEFFHEPGIDEAYLERLGLGDRQQEWREVATRVLDNNQEKPNVA